MSLSRTDIEKIESASISEGLGMISKLFPGKVVFSSSLGQEDQVLTDVIFKNDLPIKIFTLDTGRLFGDTYDLLERTVARYKKPIQVYFPEAADVEEFVTTKGVNSFYESVENRKQCCHIRKVKPLNRALQGASVWITGVRAEQSDNRKEMPMIEWLEDKQIYKFNPLLNWTYAPSISPALNKNGIDPARACEILLAGGARNVFIEKFLAPQILKGKLDVGFTLGLLFLSVIFYPILGFGDSRYLGPAGAPLAPPPPAPAAGILPPPPPA